jgi:hypothetical protein
MSDSMSSWSAAVECFLFFVFCFVISTRVWPEHTVMFEKAEKHRNKGSQVSTPRCQNVVVGCY